MAVKRDNPYGAFNFQVTADHFGGDPKAVIAGFQEVSGIGMEVTVAEYRNGNESRNHVRKMNGIYKASDVTFKRGVIGTLEFFNWIQAVGNGDPSQRETVRVELKDDTGQNTVMTWTMLGAKHMKYTGATLNAKGGTDVAIEELVLSVEDFGVS